MKSFVINVPVSEAERIKHPMINMMRSTDPIIFRDRYGRMFVVVHGKKNNGFIGWKNETELRDYVQSHSNLKDDEELQIISCFSATNEDVLHNPKNKFYEPALTEYPVFYNGINIEEGYIGTLSFSIIDNVEEIPIFARGLAATLTISEEKAKAIIIGDD